jgi:NTE family protein
MNNRYEFFEELHELGRQAAQRFLDAHFDAIGIRGTLDAAGETDTEYAGE